VNIGGGAVNSLVRSTSRSRRTKSIVSLERGICSCVELQVFLVTEAEGKHVRRRARFQQHRDASCHPPPLRPNRPLGKAPKENHAIPTETLGEQGKCQRQNLGGPV
jgi:hypothetical protein